MSELSLLTTLNVASSGMNVQRGRLNVIAENLANVNSTKTEDGGAYRRKEAIIQAMPFKSADEFANLLDAKQIQIASVTVVKESTKPLPQIYDPSHPDSDENGYLEIPDVQVSQELMDMMSAARSYEANVTAFNTTKSMVLKTLEIGGA